MAFRTSTRSLLPTIVASMAAELLALTPTAPAWAKATTPTTVETIPVTFDTFSCGGCGGKGASQGEDGGAKQGPDAVPECLAPCARLATCSGTAGPHDAVASAAAPYL